MKIVSNPTINMKYLLYLMWLVFATIPAKSQQTEDIILELSLKKFDWLINQQTDSLALYLDDQLMYIHSNGMIETKEELLNNNKSGALTYYEVELTDARIRYKSETAILTGLCSMHAAMGENELKATLLITEVYVFINNRWQLISRHASRMP
jgi:hypothetical protein